MANNHSVERPDSGLVAGLLQENDFVDKANATDRGCHRNGCGMSAHTSSAQKTGHKRVHQQIYCIYVNKLFLIQTVCERRLSSCGMRKESPPAQKVCSNKPECVVIETSKHAVFNHIS